MIMDDTTNLQFQEQQYEAWGEEVQRLFKLIDREQPRAESAWGRLLRLLTQAEKTEGVKNVDGLEPGPEKSEAHSLAEQLDSLGKQAQAAELKAAEAESSLKEANMDRLNAQLTHAIETRALWARRRWGEPKVDPFGEAVPDPEARAF